jgi:hypothetical protein
MDKIQEISFQLDRWLREIDSAHIDKINNKQIGIFFEDGSRYFFSKKYLYLVAKKGSESIKMLKSKHDELLEMENDLLK